LEQRIFHKLTAVEDVPHILEKYIDLKPLGIEEVDIVESIGRVLAEDVYAPIDYPPFDRSVVDGYAVRNIDVSSADELNPVKVLVRGRIEPGEQPKVEIGKGEAVEIATGAMIPRGADSIVMVEYTERISDKEALIYRPTTPGENISTAGSDISAGDLVVIRGTLITSKVAGILAGLGINRVKVYKKPRVAVYSIGNEIVKPGTELPPGKVYDVNSYILLSELRKIGVNADYLGILRDNWREIREALSRALENYDVVITSGGTSAGASDLVYRVFDELGEPGVIVHGLKVKPGKPTVLAVVQRKILIGLPGFPLSCYMVFDRVVKPILFKLIGMEVTSPQVVKALVPYRIKKPVGITWFLPVALIKTSQGYTAYPVSFESGSLSALYNSDGYLVLPATTDTIVENTQVTVHLFRDLQSVPSLNIIGSNDYILYELLVSGGLAGNSRVIVTGSTGGWLAVKRGEADIAPTHLLDEASMTYNTPFLDKYGLRGKAVIVRGYKRLIGIIVQRGNPKNITGIKDFMREDVVIVNRTKGSGTRVFLDHVLKELAKTKNLEFTELVNKINGYYYEVKTHTAVALAVKQGRADAGLGLGVVAKLYDLDFIPLTWENFDFLVLKNRINKEEVKKFIDLLRNRDFMERMINRYREYYRLSGDTGSIVED